MKLRPLAFAASILFLSTLHAQTAQIGHAAPRIGQDQLWVDETAQPQLYGAELQYFRLRAGYGPNIPRKKVIALWNAALDRMVEAGMNSISFYIPWDFHEIAEGKFDFTGTADDDGDGRPDYPSRDIFTFFKLIEDHGIHRIMVRPGPYINAEWGFLGFGAIPLWFHEKYPDSHMRNAQGLRTKLYDYHNPDLLRLTERWFAELHRQVLKDRIGPGKPILFVQLDNETNFMWQSIYNHDYGDRAQTRYREFLFQKYKGDLEALNLNHGGSWSTWTQVRPPIQPGLQLGQDQDWYRFQDESIHSYLEKIRRIWEKIGVREPEILFTLAESYNAMENGLLPNFAHRSDPGKTGMMTVNLYPKTYENPNHSFLNLPFKSDHDVKAMSSALENYLGGPEQWLLGPEIQGGWWQGTEVSSVARMQTYLTTVGHGMKALFVYYFTEGDQWQSEWARNQVLPLFTRLRAVAKYAGLPESALPDSFWHELQNQVDRELLVGMNAKALLYANAEEAQSLYFDAPLDKNAKPRAHYEDLKKVGNRYLKPLGAELGRARAIEDPVVILKDDRLHVPSPSLDSVRVNSDWSAALLGWVMQTGANPKIRHWGINRPEEIAQAQIIMNQDTGLSRPDVTAFFRTYLEKGGVVVNLLDDRLAQDLGLSFPKTRTAVGGQGLAVTSLGSAQGNDGAMVARAPFVDHYSLSGGHCTPLLKSELGTAGYRCSIGQGTFIQLGVQIYAQFNSDDYTFAEKTVNYRNFMSELLAISKVTPQIEPDPVSARLVAFGRSDAVTGNALITVKNGNLFRAPLRLRVQLQSAHESLTFLQPTQYRVTDLFQGTTSEVTQDSLRSEGFQGNDLGPLESTVYHFEPLP